MGNGNDTKTQWTPEQTNQLLKEIVTAVLGVLIVVITLILALKTFNYAGEDTKINDAKDVLQVLVGIAGVVIGYYFGRVPADAHAAKAQEQADAANAQSEQITSEAEALAGQVDQVMDRMTPGGAATRGGGMQTPGIQNMDDLQKIRDDLKALSNLGRRRR